MNYTIKEIMEELLKQLHDIRDNLDEMDITEYNQLMRIDDDIDEALECANTLSDLLKPIMEDEDGGEENDNAE